MNVDNAKGKISNACTRIRIDRNLRKDDIGRRIDVNDLNEKLKNFDKENKIC